MTIRTQLLVDRFVAKPIAYTMNFITRLLGKILRINHELDREFKTIAICKFKGMGSIIQATPMIGAIRKNYPNAKIIFVSTKSNEKFLQNIDWIDKVVLIDDKGVFKFIGSNIKALFTLIKNRPQVYFDLEIYSDYSTLFTLFTLSTNRVGFYLRSSTYRMGIYTHMMYYNPHVAISDVYLQMAKLICEDINNIELYPLGKKSNNKQDDYIVINPNASDLRLERRWSKTKFIELIKLININYPKLKIYLVGSKQEQVYTESITSEINNVNVVNTAGDTSLDGLIDVIANAKLMISNDTGPMHIAFSTTTPVICLFGPCSPGQYGMSKYAHVIYKNTYCSPCVHDFEIAPCKGDNVCMQSISTEEVFRKFISVFNNPEKENSNKDNEPYQFTTGKKVLGLVKR